jgi:hypothetical protein
VVKKNKKKTHTLLIHFFTYVQPSYIDVPISPFSAGVPTPPITETRPIFNETTKISCSDFVQQQQQTTSLWAVAPKKPSTDSSSSSTKGIALYDPPPQKIPQKIVEEDPPSSPSVSQKSSISLSDGETSNEEDMFGERPSVDKLFRDIDRYLPGHDLDQPQPAISKRVGLGHRPSVRVVAKDAHRRWKQATNVIRINQMLRRKSTKMWGVKVERVKPGEEIISPHPNYGDMPGKVWFSL